MASGLKTVRNRRDDALTRIGWEEFERLLGDYYRREGYAVEHVGSGGSRPGFDGGIDLKLRKDDAYIIVQCKHWNAYKVPHNQVHQLLGVMVNQGATGAILVTSGEFTRAAIEAATRQGHVQLINGDDLRAMLGPLPELASVPVPVMRGRRDAAPQPVAVAVAKWLLPTVLLIVFALIVFQFIKSTIRNIPVQQQARAQAQRQTAAQSTATPMPAVTASDTVGSRGPDPCREIIDAQSGTYIDHCAQPSPAHTPTAAEIRESQRKADEAMKVIEANTPDM